MTEKKELVFSILLEKICSHLRLVDILHLFQTCKSVQKIICGIKNIWRDACFKLPRPEGLSEKEYLSLILKKGCQYCQENKSGVKIYWAWNIRSCKKCIETRILEKFSLCELPYEELIIDTTPLNHYYYKKFKKIIVYLKSDIDSATNEYKELLPEERDEWLIQKARACQERMRIIPQRKGEMKQYQELLDHRQKNIKARRIASLHSKCKEIATKEYSYHILIKTPSFKKSCKVKEELTDRSWKILHKKLIEEHNKIRDLRA
ncbi:hypothetical protein C1645_757243 [Glomus cerebriforme]|uniref:F-box domain-containing protein n=1 Tax=Glomus cerebriforme TaxID=658196 RepID=A0A397TF58_9GLOM|nr:hypothetical protein C1645_757243 [Glomus cerebriforme]